METKILTTNDEDIAFAAEIIRNGGVVGFPTETVYGLGGNALDASAAEKIFTAKGRPKDNPLIVHISGLSQWGPLVKEIPPQAMALAERFWPGPLTIILEKSDLIPLETSGGLNTVAVRMPMDETARRLIETAGIPVAAPSANTSGMPSPTKARYVIEDMMGRIDAIIDGGDCTVGLESTVITLATDKPKLLRPGGVTVSMLEAVLGEIDIDPAVYDKLDDTQKASSPGMKYKHYAPKAKVTLLKGSFEKFAEFIDKNADEKTVALCFDGEEDKLGIKCITYGKENDSLSQAQRVFTALREVDETGAERVYARYPDRKELGLAVYNRLIRAAAFEVIEL
ncbi:MAG: threonylcarbamoyl-AMP synthase [Clostridia bacterium]|nr:threonylcarbamoyl-AMP synthase [Clostridia bacterium]